LICREPQDAELERRHRTWTSDSWCCSQVEDSLL